MEKLKRWFAARGPLALSSAAVIISLFALVLPLAVVTLPAIRQQAATVSRQSASHTGSDIYANAFIAADDVHVTDDLVVTGTQTLDGVALSGPVRFGTQSGVTDGVTITHGIGTTPTVVILSTDSVTRTYAASVDAALITVGMEASDGAVTVHWLAGK